MRAIRIARERQRIARWPVPNARVRSWLFLAAIVVAELVTAWVNPLAGLSLHALILLGWIPLTALEQDRREQSLMIASMLLPVIRLVSLALPLHLLSPLAWYPATAIPLYVAAWKVARMVGLPAKRMGLRGEDLPRQFLIGVAGVGIGIIQFQVLRLPPFMGGSKPDDTLLAGLVLVLFAGFLDELLFRGLLQALAYRTMGSAGPVYVAFLYAAMHLGYRSPVPVLAALGLGLVFGAIAHRSQSIVGIALAHGLANIVAYLVMPVLQGRVAITGSMVVPALGIISIGAMVALAVGRSARQLSLAQLPRKDGAQEGGL